MNIKLALLSLAVVLPTAFAEAQSFTVKKVKGRQAVINMTSGSFSEGQTVDVGGSSSGSFSGGGGSRDKFVGLSGAMTSAKPAGATSQITSIGIDLLYGLNKGKMEYGVLGRLGTSSGGTVNTTSFGIGGKFDYNLVDHRPGTDFVYGAGGEAVYSTVSTGSSVTTMTIFPSVSAKWFLLGTPTALRVDAGIEMNQTSANGANSTSSGLKVTLGLYNYF